MSQKICTRFRCVKYVKDAVSPLNILNCTTTAWWMNCSGSCIFRNYAMSLEPTPENPNGSYVPEEEIV